MKKLTALFVAMFFVLAGSFAYATGSAVKVPTVSGNDVLIPQALIDTVAKGVKTPNIVAVMHDAIQGHEVPMTFDGTNWVAPGARGADFHPALKTADGTYVWAKIEDVWSTGSEFVKWRKAGPCLNLK